MKTISLLFLLGASVIVDAYAINKDGSIPVNPDSEINALAKVTAFVPMGKSKPSKSLPDQKFQEKTYKAIRLTGGLQLHPSCDLEASRAGKSAKDLKVAMDSLMTTMLDRIVRCAEQYPEIKGYLKQSISQYRRKTIRCEPPKGSIGMINPLSGNLESKYEAYYDQADITVSHNWFKKVFIPNDHNSNSALSTIFHELLHSTKCNNRHDHNKIERIPASAYVDKKACIDNVTMDRISVVQSLCMGTNLNSAKDSAALILADRMNMCGNDRGCRHMFTDEGNSYGFFNKLMGRTPQTKDISDADATKLCQRIKDDGMCLHFRNTQGKIITDANPKIKEVRKRLKKRLGNILPGLSNKIPTDFLALYPDLAKRFNSVKDTSCLKRHFHSSKDNSNEVYAIRTKTKTILPDSWKKNRYAISDHLRRINYDLINFLSRSKDSKCVKDRDEIKAVLTEFADNISKDPTITQLHFVMNGEEKGIYPQVKELKDPDSNLAKLLGKKLVRDYSKAMDQFHADSPSYDCIAAGLAPFRFMEAVTKKSELCEQ